MLNKPRWDLKSRWTLRQQQPTTKNCLMYLFEHEVTVSTASSSIELVAKFVHILPQDRASLRLFGRGGLISILIRNRDHRRANLKRTNARKGFDRKLQTSLRAIDVSPQSRTAISESTSPVMAPLALPTNSGIVPTISTSESIKKDIGVASALPSPAVILPEQTYTEINVTPFQAELPGNATVAQTCSWLRTRHFQAFESTFANFSASDILRLSRDDLIQICGLADGIRLFNALHARTPQPKLILYFAMEGSGNTEAITTATAAELWRAIYLDNLTSASLTSKLLAILDLSHDRLHSVLLLGPQGIHVLVTNELIANMKDESMFVVEIIKEPVTDSYKLLLKPSH